MNISFHWPEKKLLNLDKGDNIQHCIYPTQKQLALPGMTRKAMLHLGTFIIFEESSVFSALPHKRNLFFFFFYFLILLGVCYEDRISSSGTAGCLENLGQ